MLIDLIIFREIHFSNNPIRNTGKSSLKEKRLYNNVRRLNLYFPVYKKPLHIQLNKVYVNTVCSIQVTICVNISKTKYAKFHTKFRIYSVSVDLNEFLKAMQIILYNLNKLGKLIQTKHAQTCHGEKNIVKQYMKILEICIYI